MAQAAPGPVGHTSVRTRPIFFSSPRKTASSWSCGWTGSRFISLNCPAGWKMASGQPDAILPAEMRRRTRLIELDSFRYSQRTAASSGENLGLAALQSAS